MQVETYVELAKIIALTLFSVLCVYLMVVLSRLSHVLHVVEHELIEFNRNVKPVLENLTVITEHVRSIAIKVDDQVTILHGLLSSCKRITDNVMHFEEQVQQILEGPFLRINALFNNVLGRVTSFFSRHSQEVF
jgi:uncharacterized protein YoxC